MNTLVTYFERICARLGGANASLDTHSHDSAHHTIGVVRDEVGGAKALPCSLRVLLVERVKRVRRVKEMLCARMPAHVVEVFGLVA
jgi:hypothetical protein